MLTTPPFMSAVPALTPQGALLEVRSIDALARDHGVSRVAIRTYVADLMPDHIGPDQAPRRVANVAQQHIGNAQPG
ncbi:hypothetical protein SHKM778_46930 [Streptomyces sp. KM77-8]|uniref:Uncharacterized protein n=1 Tax=Streptomyces haneummycinicus TaxID=3074435 RepID=A0AAT9HLS2_9ACTN